MPPSPYVTREIFPEAGFVMVAVWLPTTRDMEEADFRAEMEASLALAQHYRPRGWLSNMQELRFPIDPELQHWVAETINPQLVAAGIERFAFVVPSELVAHLALEQAVEEVANTPQPGQFAIRYFATPEAAWAWLLG
jgi:hypothetical protein